MRLELSASAWCFMVGFFSGVEFSGYAYGWQQKKCAVMGYIDIKWAYALSVIIWSENLYSQSMNLFVLSISQIWMRVSACNHVIRLVIKLPFVTCSTTACEQALQVQWTRLLVWSMIQSSQMLVTGDILQWCEPRGLQFTNLWKYIFYNKKACHFKADRDWRNEGLL